MCLITEQKTPVKTRKDKIVYKAVEVVIDEDNYNVIPDKVRAFYENHFIYDLKKLYETDFSYLHVDDIHACPCDDLATKEYGDKEERPKKELTVVAEGFHSMKTLKRTSHIVTDNRDELVVKATIPKGSLVFEDKTGLLVSNKIILNEILPKE